MRFERLSTAIIAISTPALVLSSTLPRNTLLERTLPASCSTCVPLPGQNQCHFTTSCVGVWQHSGTGPVPYYCACRAGYKASSTGTTSPAQWRLPWRGEEGRVFVQPGLVCDVLCDHWELGAQGCKEVPEFPQCM